MVHCFQHNCHGGAPGGLIEGIADYVRLKAGLAPPHWHKGSTAKDRGEKWDEGYQRTAWFLEWLEDEHGTGTVSRINAAMRERYDEEKFWEGLFGEKVQTLWQRYCNTWGEEKEGNVDKDEGPSRAETEPEIVDLSAEEKKEADQELRKL